MNKKIYGIVKAVKANKEGVYYAQIEDLNEKGEIITICAGDTGEKFGGVVLKEGMRIACTGEGEKVFLVKGKVKTYKDHPKKGDHMKPILFGNAVNVAEELLDCKWAKLEEVYELAEEIYKKGIKEREEVLKKYPNMKESDAGAKWGTCLKFAARYTNTIEDMFDLAKEAMGMHIRYEERL